MSDILLQERTDDGILLLTLNRPDVINCFNFDLLAELANAIMEANFDMDLRCIIISGARVDREISKQAFSTGAVSEGEKDFDRRLGKAFHLYDPQYFYGSGECSCTRHCRN